MKKAKIEVYEVNVIVKLKKELKFDEVSTVISSILMDMHKHKKFLKKLMKKIFFQNIIKN